MQNPQNSSPSTGQKKPSALPFLQDSSLITQLPSDESSQLVRSSDSKAEQKLLSPPKLSLAQLDSQGGIRINITIPASALTLGQLLGEGAYGSVYQGVWNDQPVAIKRLKAQLLTEKAIEELRQEAQIMFQLGRGIQIYRATEKNLPGSAVLFVGDGVDAERIAVSVAAQRSGVAVADSISNRIGYSVGTERFAWLFDPAPGFKKFKYSAG